MSWWHEDGEVGGCQIMQRIVAHMKELFFFFSENNGKVLNSLK